MKANRFSFFFFFFFSGMPRLQVMSESSCGLYALATGHENRQSHEVPSFFFFFLMYHLVCFMGITGYDWYVFKIIRKL